MKYKWVIMQELEESNIATPYKIVGTEKRATRLTIRQIFASSPMIVFVKTLNYIKDGVKENETLSYLSKHKRW